MVDWTPRVHLYENRKMASRWRKWDSGFAVDVLNNINVQASEVPVKSFLFMGRGKASVNPYDISIPEVESVVTKSATPTTGGVATCARRPKSVGRGRGRVSREALLLASHRIEERLNQPGKINDVNPKSILFCTFFFSRFLFFCHMSVCILYLHPEKQIWRFFSCTPGSWRVDTQEVLCTDGAPTRGVQKHAPPYKFLKIINSTFSFSYLISHRLSKTGAIAYLKLEY